MNRNEQPDPIRLKERIHEELVSRGLPDEFELEIRLHPERRMLSLELTGGPDNFEVRDMYNWLDSPASIAEDIVRHYRSGEP